MTKSELTGHHNISGRSQTSRIDTQARWEAMEWAVRLRTAIGPIEGYNPPETARQTVDMAQKLYDWLTEEKKS